MVRKRAMKNWGEVQQIAGTRIMDDLHAVLSNGQGATIFFSPYNLNRVIKRWNVVEAHIHNSERVYGRGFTTTQLDDFPSIPTTEFSNKLGFVVISIFLFDWSLIDPWLKHYRKQGASHFILYFNSHSIPSELKSFLASQVDVSLIMWPFRHRAVSAKFRDGRPFLSGKGGFLNHALELLKTRTKFTHVLCVDLDEYVIGTRKISDLLEDPRKEWSFSNIWAKGYNAFVENGAARVSVDAQFTPWHRVKSLVRIDAIDHLDPHRIYNENNLTQEFIMLHFLDAEKEGWVAPTRSGAEGGGEFIDLKEHVLPDLRRVYLGYKELV